MLKTKNDMSWFKTSGLMIGTLLVFAIAGISFVQAELNESIDHNTHCVRVGASDHLAQTRSGNMLHSEPEDDRLVEEDVNIVTGLYIRAYSLRQNGVVDYKTARQIVISEYNEYWNTVVHTKEFPLFYWQDVDQDGQFDMWVDQQGEGAPCDIVPYEIKPDAQTAGKAGF